MKTHDIKKLKIADIEDAPYNPRTISDKARAGLGDSMNEFGLLEVPIVNTHGGKKRLIGGHRRLEQLKASDYTHVDCIVVDFDPADEMAANLVLNSSAIRGRFDAHKLPEALLKELERDIPRPDFAGFDEMMDDLRAKSGYAESMRRDGAEAGDDQVEVGTKVRSKVGTVYRLGEHRLFCGDYREGMRKLFGKKKAAVTITDPPYGEEYQARNGDEVEGDESKPFRAQMTEWAKAIVRKSDVVYLFCSSRRIADVDAVWTDVHTGVWQWLVWVKDRPTTQFPNYRGDYHHQAEFVMFGGRGDAPKVPGHANILEFPKPRQNELHPTQKPTALIRRLMEDSTAEGDLVFDPFLGSGTTLVVAEELKRICIGSEVDPQHCDTIRRRWAQQVHGDVKDWTKKTPAVRKARRRS